MRDLGKQSIIHTTQLANDGFQVEMIENVATTSIVPEGVFDPTSTSESFSGNFTAPPGGQQTRLLVKVLQAAMAVVILFANTLIISAVSRMSPRVLPIHLWIAHLALADALVGVTFALRFIMDVAFPFNEPLCKTIMILMTTSCAASVTGLLIMSIKSYFDITNSALYVLSTGTTKRITIAQIIAVWGFWIIVPTIGLTLNTGTADMTLGCSMYNEMFDKGFLLFLSILMYVFITCIAVFQFGLLYRVKKHVDGMVDQGIIVKSKSMKPLTLEAYTKTRHSKLGLRAISAFVEFTSRFATEAINITKEEEEEEEKKRESDSQSAIEISPDSTSQSERDDTLTGTCISTTSNTQHEHRRQRHKEHMTNGSFKSGFERWNSQIVHLAKLTTCVVVLFTLCWLPFAVTLTIYCFCSDQYCPVDSNTLLACSTLLSSNSLMNVFVYAIKSKEFRDLFKVILTCNRCVVLYK